MRVLKVLSVVSLSALVAGSCSSSPTTPTGTIVHSCGGGTFSGSMSATVGGQSFVATCLDAASFASGIIGFGGTNIGAGNATSYVDISMAVVATGPGTFQVSANSANNAILSIGGSQFWQAGAASTGTGTIAGTLTTTGVSGTFSFNFVAGPGGSGTKSVTNGVFNITF